MKISSADQLSKIVRQIESDLGTSKLAELALINLLDSFDCFKAKSLDDFYEQFKELVMLIKTTKPRIGLLIFYFCDIWEELLKRRSYFEDMAELKIVVKEIIHLLLQDQEMDTKKLLEHGLSVVKNGDRILIHSHSRTVLTLLKDAHEAGKNFQVVLAEQEEEKTHEMMAFLSKNDIPFVSIPEFMLSHLEKDVTKVFLGGITFNNSYNFITDAGTNSVVSEFHHAHVPIYMFLTTKKFSRWDATKREQTYKVTQHHLSHHSKEPISYERIKFSHDRIPVDLLDFVVTEEGIYDPKKFKALFDKNYREFKTWRTKYMS